MANQDGTLKEVLSSKDHLGRRENPFESYRTPAVLGSVRAIHSAVSILAGHLTPVKHNRAFVSPSPHILQLPSYFHGRMSYSREVSASPDNRKKTRPGGSCEWIACANET